MGSDRAGGTAQLGGLTVPRTCLAYLNKLALPAGAVDIVEPRPSTDVILIGPKSSLVVRAESLGFSDIRGGHSLDNPTLEHRGIVIHGREDKPVVYSAQRNPKSGT